LRGISLYSKPGEVFHDPVADEALFDALRENLDRDRVELCEMDVDINDVSFGLAMANRLHELCHRT
jgi:uncharacterized protein (UPF0261 family)